MYSPSSAIENVPSRADMTVERMRFVLDQDGHLPQAGVQAVAQREIDDAIFPAERHRRFRALLGKRIQAFALPARQHHGEDLSHRRADCSRTTDE
jgi:hypothetical protein